MTYTSFVSGAQLLEALPERDRDLLWEPYFYTPFDVMSKDNNNP